MSENICRIGSEIICHSRTEDSGRIIAQVRLHYSVSSYGENVMTTRIELIEGKGDRWRKTKRRIIANAWDWLEEYFDGACFGSDQVNIFSNEASDEEVVDVGKATFELSPDQEADLQRELRQIELSFAV